MSYNALAVFTFLLAFALPASAQHPAARPRRVLMLTTSADRFPDGHPTGLWLEEFAGPYLALRRVGVEGTVVSPRGGAVPIDPRSRPTPQEASAWQAASPALAQTTALSPSVRAADYDGLFVPGGHGCMVDLADSAAVHNLVGDFARQGKVIAAVCHGPVALLGATLADGSPLLRGKRATVFTDEEEAAAKMDHVIAFSPQQRLAAEGVDFIPDGKFTSHVVRDGQLITGQNPASSAAAVAAMLEELEAAAK